MIDDENKNEELANAEIILYQSDGSNVPVGVRYMNEDFWLTQKEIADLFGVKVPAINKHLANIYDEGELEVRSTISKMEIVQTEGHRNVRRDVALYNLDAIIAVGYRVNSLQATRFRQWATTTLKEYITKGFVINDDFLKNGVPFGQDYFDELLVRVRDIRASERRVYQKIADIFQECSFDYDKNSDMAKKFYADVQNKLHFAVTGHTAAEIVTHRADASKSKMGLTSWKGSPDGRIHSSDVSIAKNYLTEEEISTLNRLVTMFLDDVELRAKDHVLMSMQDCSEALDGFLAYNRRDILQGQGTRSHTQAKEKALAEFEEFRKIQDREYMSDFDKQVKSLNRPD